MKVFEFLSIIIGFLAILLTVVTVIQNRRHNRKSVRPTLVIRFHLGGSKGRYGISVKNDGLGPALIKSCEVKIGEEIMNDVGDNGWESVIDHFKLRDMNPAYETISPDGVISSGERIWLISTAVNVAYSKRLKEVLDNIKIKLSYESVYSEKFVTYFR